MYLSKLLMIQTKDQRIFFWLHQIDAYTNIHLVVEFTHVLIKIFNDDFFLIGLVNFCDHLQ